MSDSILSMSDSTLSVTDSALSWCNSPESKGNMTKQQWKCNELVMMGEFVEWKENIFIFVISLK